ncbi:MAG: carboxypeptidase regulatory-like domain-containing protein, partial [Ignavibacteriales bacterium]|nr:carboxypeptidase regulatory-like domain-containing protein [Ignavibacteriales bacterium]
SVWCEWEVTHSDKAGNPNGTFLLTLNEDGSYSGEFDTEGTTLVVGDTIHYAIYARDNGSGHLLGRLPENGNFNFTFIADNTLPTIVHNPLRNQPRLRWPSTVKATVSDLLGIEEVLVEWYKNDVGNSSSFELESDDNDNYAGIFNSDSNMIAIGDSIFYRIKATDASNSGNVAYYPEEGYWKFSIIATKGIVLVIDDDATGSFRAMPKSGSSFKADTIDMNGSAGLFRRTLTELGYIVDTMKVPQVDTTEWDNYDIVVWSHGRSSSPADSVKWRRALSSRVQRGMSVIIEGGDIGWQYMSSSTDVDFATNVLHCNDFIMESNTLANPKLKDPTHPLATNPNTLPAQYTLEGTAGVYDRDANQPLLNATTVFSWSGNDTTMSVLAWDDTPNPLRGRVVYIGFNINNVVKAESTEVKNLIENAADWLVGSEPPPTGAASGMVTLQNTSDNSGVNVRIKGPTIDETIQTPESGYYRFENLYAGTHKLYAWKNGYYPAMDSLVINVGSDSSINNNFTFMPTGPVSGTIILQGTPNNSGVNVVIKGSGTNDTLVTPESGMYEFSNLNAGLHKIYAWKTGYYPTIDSLSVVVTAETLANRNFSFAQLVLGAVSGSVTLEGTNDHSGVEVKILNHNLTATTQTNGSYQFSNVTPGPISLRFSKSGYARKDTLTALPNGGSLTVNVHLKTLSNIILVVYDSTLTNGRVSKDSIAQNLEAMNLPYEVRNRGGNTSTIEFSMSDYNTVIWLGEGTSTSSLSQRDSIKSFLINGVPSSPSKLIIFAEDFGYQHGRSGSTYLDLELCNNYLGWNYVADRPGTGASQGIIGDYINNGIADSTVGTWPDVLSPYDGEVTVGLYRFRRHDSLNAIGHITDNFVTATFGVDIRSLRSAFDSPPGSPVTRLLTGALNFVNEPVGVDARAAREIPTVYSLSQNYPNPFNPVTTIRFGLPEESNTTLRVFNVLGQEVAILLNNVQSAGYHEFQWDAASVSSGVYFYRLEATSVTSNKTFTKINKMVLMK